MTTAERLRYTLADYIERELSSRQRFEYYQGDILPVAEASKPHNVIVMNCGASFHAQFRQRDCFVYTSDMRVRIHADHYIYPDVAVVCGDEQMDSIPLDTLLNPALLLEVLSFSTEEADITVKARAFRAMPSLREYLFVSQKEVYVEHYRRDNSHWILSEYESLHEVILLTSVGCTLALADLYEKVTF